MCQQTWVCPALPCPWQRSSQLVFQTNLISLLWSFDWRAKPTPGRHISPNTDKQAALLTPDRLEQASEVSTEIHRSRIKKSMGPESLQESNQKYALRQKTSLQ